MASLNIPNTFTNGTTANATEVNANFAAVKSFVETSTVQVDGSVKAGVSSLDFGMTGLVVPYVGASAPAGWLLCRGQLVSKTTYSALYAVVGPNAFGTDTATEFYLPNLQGRVPVGVSTSDTDFDRGDVGGAKSVTLTASQSGLRGHGHSVNQSNAGYHDHTVSVGGGAHQHSLYVDQLDSTTAHGHGSDGTVASGTSATPEGNTRAYTETFNSGYEGNHSHSGTTSPTGDHGHSVSVNPASDANAIDAHTNLQPYISLNYIVKT